MNGIVEPSACAPMRDARETPRLRGVSHQHAFFWTIAATLVLMATARPGIATAVVGVFGASLANLFGTSALYHRLDWSPSARRIVKRLDHAAIFVSMAGGYTPLFALVRSSAGDHRALWIVWLGAAMGVLKSLLWPDAPKRLSTLLYAMFGWAVFGEVLDRAVRIGPLGLALLLATGVLFSVGAVVYATERPNPLPRVFGFHEVFHALIVAGTACLFAHVIILLRMT